MASGAALELEVHESKHPRGMAVTLSLTQEWVAGGFSQGKATGAEGNRQEPAEALKREGTCVAGGTERRGQGEQLQEGKPMTRAGPSSPGPQSCPKGPEIQPDSRIENTMT